MITRRTALKGAASVMALGFSPASADDPTALRSHAPDYATETYSYSGKTRVHPSAVSSANTKVVLLLGQSQGCNLGSSHTIVNSNTLYNLSLENGAIYAAADPLLSTTGTGGCVLTRLYDGLVTSGYCSKALLLSINIGSTGLAEWLPGGIVHYRMAAAAKRLLNVGLPPTEILWMQGETDNIRNTSKATYIAGIQTIRSHLDSLGLTAPMWIAKETWVEGAVDANVQDAQTEVVNGTTIKAGPNFDTMDGSYRGTSGAAGTDFDDDGVTEAAVRWAAILDP